MYGEGNDYRTRCGAFVTATGQQCTLDSDHDGAHPGEPARRGMCRIARVARQTAPH
jgi:hypothetical protein